MRRILFYCGTLSLIRCKEDSIVISRSIVGTVLLATASLGLVTSVTAVTPVAASQYGLEVTHSELGRADLEQGKQGIELQVTLNNQGAHDLYDVRVFLERAGARVMLKGNNPARLQALSAGEQKTLSWTFEMDQPLVGPLREVVFRVEAVDSSTQQIVKFSQKSKEAR
jgi:hypothetical protein